MTNPNQHTGLAALGDRMMSPEMKVARDALVDRANSWLMGVHNQCADGSSSESLIAHETIGILNDAVNVVSISYSEGMSITGNGVDSPVKVQYVGGDPLEALEITGTDPMEAVLHGAEYAPTNRRETVLSYGVTNLDVSPNDYFRFTVRGDGTMSHDFLQPDGVHTSRGLGTLQDIEVASMAFDDVTNTLVARAFQE